MTYSNSYKVYVTGGLQIANSSPLNTIYEFGASNYLLGLRRKNMNHPRYGHGSVSIKGFIFVFGGFAHKDIPGEPPRTLNTCEKFTPATNSWEITTTMNEARAFFGACAMENQYIYCFGGFHDYEMLSNIEKYDTITDTWITLYYKLPYPLAKHASIACDKRNILIMGGMSSDFDPLATVLNLDINTAKFSKKAPMRNRKLMDGGVYLARDTSVFVISSDDAAGFKSERYVVRDLY